ncbi:MAG: D-2-hydroxyacid dehydrogenase [Lachnospiraceae bacterium]|nr:D-2-hydroxyacid dehydrogenase [Lachnospiraceae bacterium]
MVRKNILVTLPLFLSQKETFEKSVSGGKYDCRFYYAPTDRHMPESLIAEGMVPASSDIPDDIHAVVGDFSAKKIAPYYDTLEFLQVAPAGFDGHVRPGVLPEGCVFLNASGAYNAIVSEQLLGLTFASVRRMRETYLQQEKHVWKHPGEMKPINGSTAVVVGMGDIGGAYAKKMKALGAYVIGVRRSEREKPDYVDEQYTVDHIDEVLPRADILCLIVPGGPETDGLLSEERMRMMKKDSVIVNAGRGTAIDEPALIRLLNEGWFFGVGLDVASKEPLPSDAPLWDAPRVTLTPHTGGAWQKETQKTIFDICVNNLHAWACGGEYTHRIR